MAYYPPPVRTEREAPLTKKRPILWIGLGCGVLILVLALVIASSGMHGSAPTGPIPAEPAPSVAVSAIKAQARSIPWAELMNNPDSYAGSVIYFRGEVLQVIRQEDNTAILRLSTKTDPSLSYTADEFVYVNYRGGGGVSENSIIDLWGNFAGPKHYTTVSGDKITVPEINSLHMETVTPAR